MQASETRPTSDVARSSGPRKVSKNTNESLGGFRYPLMGKWTTAAAFAFFTILGYPAVRADPNSTAQKANGLLQELNAAAQRAAAGSPAWAIETVDHRPTVEVDGLAGYRIVLRRTWKEFTGPPQQQAEAAPNTDRRPSIEKHEDWQFVLFPKEPKKAPVELKSKIPWAKSDSPYYVRDVCMGEGLGFVWFTRGTLFGQESLRDRLRLQGGDERIALLIDGMQVEDKGAMTANSCQHAISRFGDTAIPLISNAIARSSEPTTTLRLIASLRLIHTDKATELLLQLYDSEREELRNNAAYALIHKPFRPAAKQAYVDMLRRHLRAQEACQACLQFQWKDTIPVLNELIARPANLRELSFTIPARRALEGNPIPQGLIDAKQKILSAGYSADQKIDQSRKLLLESKDTEATLLIAIELATFSSKGISRRPNKVGIELLRSRPRETTVSYLKRLIREMPPENRQQVRKLLQSVMG